MLGLVQLLQVADFCIEVYGRLVPGCTPDVNVCSLIINSLALTRKLSIQGKTVYVFLILYQVLCHRPKGGFSFNPEFHHNYLIGCIIGYLVFDITHLKIWNCYWGCNYPYHTCLCTYFYPTSAKIETMIVACACL